MLPPDSAIAASGLHHRGYVAGARTAVEATLLPLPAGTPLAGAVAKKSIAGKPAPTKNCCGHARRRAAFGIFRRECGLAGL